MKNWLTIGQFSKKLGISTKALRLYEEMGLLRSHTRGENGYRYYDASQIELATRLKDFKKLGFSLLEIKSLLQADKDLMSDTIAEAMKSRLSLIMLQLEHLGEQKKQIEEILISLEKKSEPLKAQQRRAIMSFYGKVSIVVTGCDGLIETAEFIQKHYKNADQEIPIIHWESTLSSPPPQEKPYILIVKEIDLASNEITNLHPDVIVIKSFGVHSEENQQNYLKLYSDIGPHVNTVVNADDRSAVEFAAQTSVRKGRIFYFSKNKGLERQISKIGGVVSDGETVEIYGFNLKREIISFQLKKIMTFKEEIALLSSYGAVMTLGLEKANLQGI